MGASGTRSPPGRGAVELASASAASGADEIFVQLPPSPEAAVLDTLRGVARSLTLPLLVAADTSDTEHIDRLLDAGASRIFIERTALDDPDLISRLGRRFGSEAVGVSITARTIDGGGRVQRGKDGDNTEWDVVTWGRVVEAQGGGEIVLRPGGARFGPEELDVLRALVSGVTRPVVAAVEGRTVEEVVDALLVGDADAVRVAAARSAGDESILQLKRSIAEHGLTVRI